MKRPTVEGALEPVLDELINEGHDARDAGDSDGALARWHEAWDLLPEPKLKWDYYAQTITRDLANLCLETGRLREAARWVERLDDACSPHTQASRLAVDFVKAKLHYRAGERDLAWTYFDAAHKAGGRRPFQGEQPEYYDFYRSHTPATPA
jgi:tetratricopeptide (TPR) repeat protein